MKVYSRFSSHVIDDDGYDLDFDGLTDEATPSQQDQIIEIAADCQQYRNEQANQALRDREQYPGYKDRQGGGPTYENGFQEWDD